MEAIKNKISETKKSQLSILQAKHFEEKLSFVKISQNNGDTDLLTDNQNPSLNNISFNEFKLPTSSFKIEKFANGIIEIINGDNHIQINSKNGVASLGQELYNKIINSQNPDDLLKDEAFQNSLSGAIGESEKYLLSFRNREKPCYSYNQTDVDDNKSYDININFGTAIATNFNTENAFKAFATKNPINKYFLVKIAENKYVKFDIVVDNDNKLVPVLSRNKSRFAAVKDGIMIYKANGLESYSDDAREMYSNDDFKQKFKEAQNIQISCKSSYYDASKDNDLFNFKDKKLGDVISRGFEESKLEILNYGQEVKDVEKEIDNKSSKQPDNKFKPKNINQYNQSNQQI